MDRETKPGFTLGPWQECKAGDCACGIVWSIPGDFPVCTAAGGSTFPVAVAHEHMADAPDLIYQSIAPEQSVANARLIAAAPTMFDALEAAEHAIAYAIRGETNPEKLALLNRDHALVSSALSRARGEPPHV